MSDYCLKYMQRMNLFFPLVVLSAVSGKHVMALLRMVFSTLTVAMRYEPANARFFATEVRYSSLTEAVRLLGCFSPSTQMHVLPQYMAPSEDSQFADIFTTCIEDK